MVVILPIVTVVCFLGAVLLARNHRKGLVRAAVGLAISMAILLIALAVGRGQYLGSLGPNRSVSANAAVIDDLTAVLRDSLWIILIVAVVIALGAMLAANPWIRRLLRSDTQT